MIYGNISTRPLSALAALATTRLGKPNIRFHQIMMMVVTAMFHLIMMVITTMFHQIMMVMTTMFHQIIMVMTTMFHQIMMVMRAMFHQIMMVMTTTTMTVLIKIVVCRTLIIPKKKVIQIFSASGSCEINF